MPPPYNQATIISYIRAFLRDNAEVNALIIGEETSDILIELAIELTLDDFSTTTPLIGWYNLQNFPSLYLLIYGSVINVLRSAGLLQTRNNLNYSDGGITVASSDKTQLLQSWIDRFFQDYETKKKHHKIQLNAEQGYGEGLVSEYAYLDYGTNTLQFGI